MSLTGAAIGAAKSLEDIVAERVLAQKLQQAIAERQQAQAMDARRLEETERQNAWSRSRTERMDAEAATERGRVRDAEDTQRRGRSNMAGVLGMGLDPETAKREIAVSALNADTDVPNGVMDMLKPPPKPTRYRVTTPGPNGQPISRLATEEEMEQGVPEYREPKPPQRPEKPSVFNVGGKLVDERGRVVYDGGANGAGGPSPYAAERAQRTVEAVDRLMGKVGGWTAGAGSMLAAIPGTDARDFDAELNTLKSNIAFNELAAMREASKTGGALGAVSDREMALLQSVLGGLDSGQSPQNLREQLRQVKDSVQRWQAAGGQPNAPMRPVTSREGAAAPTVDPKAKAAELIKKYGGKQ